MSKKEVLRLYDDYVYEATKTIDESWNTLKKELYKGKIKYNDLNELYKQPFFIALEGVVCLTKKEFECRLEDVTYMYRAAQSGKCNSYSRFIPSEEYFTKESEANRFNPPGGGLYTYLGIGRQLKGIKGKELNTIEMTCLKEIRAEQGKEVHICQFKTSDNSRMKKLFNMNIDGDKEVEYFRSKLEDELDEVVKKMKRVKRVTEKARGDVPSALKHFVPATDILERYWSARTMANAYFHIIMRDLFEKVDGKDKELEYAPFHAMAYYFKEKGYDGLIYKSTVYEEGENLVLFDINDVTPVGEIKHAIY